MRRWRSLFAASALSAGLLVAAAACGGPKQPLSGGGTSGGGSTVAVSLTEYKIGINGTQLSHGSGGVTLKAGPTTFNVKNDGTTTHALEIQGNGTDAKTDDLDPGKSATLKVDLKPGTYEVWCPVPGHKDLGMDGKVQVQ